MTIAAPRSLKATRPLGFAGRALRWWLGELRGICQDSARPLGLGRRSETTIEAGERYWIVQRRRQIVGQIDWQHAGPAQCREQLRRLIGGSGRLTVSVELPQERVLAKTIRLPLGAAGNHLDRILGFEIGRQFPFPADRLFYRYRPIADRGESSDRTGIAVELAAVPRDAVAAICAEVSAAGFRVSGVAMFTEGNAEPLLLPNAVGPARSGEYRLPVMVVLAASIGAAASWPLAQQSRITSIEREIAVLKPRAEAVLSERERQRRSVDRDMAILALRLSRPPLIEVLDDLSRGVPDNSWLTSLSISGREVVIDGLSPSAAGVVQALERTGRFANIVFRSSINRDQVSGLERFRLGAVIPESRR
jgi:general secretion pathway protein L